MTKTYIYKGQVKVDVPGFGIVKPGEQITTEKEIKHSHFEIKKEPTAQQINKKLKIKTKK